MKDKYTKKMLIGMMFLSSNLYHNTVRASFLTKILRECPVGSLEQPLDQCNKGRFLCRQPSKNAVWIFFKQQTPNRSQTELVEAVRDKKTDTAMRILLLNSICPTLDNHGGVLNYLLHVAIQNDDILTLGALLNARYRDENGNERRLFDVNYEYNELTPLMLAVTLGRNEMIQFLLSVCVNIFVQTRRGTVLHCALKANDLDLTVRIMQAIKDQPSLEKRKFLNLTNANQETVFHVIFKCFLQGETFPLLLCTVLSYSPYYDFKESGKQEQIFEDAKKTLNQLRDDEKRFKVIKTFKMDRDTRRDTIQAVCRSINYLCK